jgi:hypothetical protein
MVTMVPADKSVGESNKNIMQHAAAKWFVMAVFTPIT